MQSDDITVAARTMTEAEPPHDLELRIKRRLDEVTPRASKRPVTQPAELTDGAGRHEHQADVVHL